VHQVGNQYILQNVVGTAMWRAVFV